MKLRSIPARFLFFLPLTLLLCGCFIANFVRYPRQVPFDESDFLAYRDPGSATVTGQFRGFWEGQAASAGAVPVTLIPVTAYTTEMVQRELGDGVLLTASDPRFRKYVRKTRADDKGGFRFTQVPAGQYYLCGEISFKKAGEEGFYDQWVCERITVGAGQNVNIIASHNPQHGNSPVNDFWTLE